MVNYIAHMKIWNYWLPNILWALWDGIRCIVNNLEKLSDFNLVSLLFKKFGLKKVKKFGHNNKDW